VRGGCLVVHVVWGSCLGLDLLLLVCFTCRFVVAFGLVFVFFFGLFLFHLLGRYCIFV